MPDNVEANAAKSTRIAITGIGLVCPDAWGTIDETAAKILGRSTPTDDGGDAAEADAFLAIPDAFRGEGDKLPGEIRREKAAWATALAFQACVRSAGIAPDDWAPERAGLSLSVAQAGPDGMIRFAEEVRGQSPRFVSPIHFPQTVGNFVAGAMARAYHLRGPNVTIGVQSPLGGLEALVEGCGFLTGGHADVVLAGGVDIWSDQLARAVVRGTAMRAGNGQTGGNQKPGAFPTECVCLFCLKRSADVREGENVIGWLDPVPQRPDSLPSLPDSQPNVGSLSLYGLTSDGSARAILPASENVLGHCPSAAGPAAIALALSVAKGSPHAPSTLPTPIDRILITLPEAYGLLVHCSAAL